MMPIDNQKLTELVNKALSLSNLPEIFTKYNQKYPDCFTFDQPVNIINKAAQINKKACKNKLKPNPSVQIHHKVEPFQFRQLKIFQWVLVVFCELYSQTLQAIDDDSIEQIHSIFPNKSTMFIRFTILHFRPKRMKNKKTTWNLEEEQLLIKVVGTNQQRNWRQISFEIYCQSQGLFFRHQNECREKWNNYLDPSVNRGKWTDQQDLDLLIEAEATDYNWSQISQEMKFFRTQHTIKNRFRSLITYYKKKFSDKAQKKIVTKAIKDLKQKIKALSQEKTRKEAETQEMQPNSYQTAKKQQVKAQNVQPLEIIPKDLLIDQKVSNPLTSTDKSKEEIKMVLIDKDRLDNWIPNQLGYEIDQKNNLVEKMVYLSIEEDEKDDQRRTNDEEDSIEEWLAQFQEREDKKYEWFDDDYAPFYDL